MKDLLDAGHWQDRAEHYLTDDYIQHNPNVPTGRQGVIDFVARIGVTAR